MKAIAGLHVGTQRTCTYLTATRAGAASSCRRAPSGGKDRWRFPRRDTASWHPSFDVLATDRPAAVDARSAESERITSAMRYNESGARFGRRPSSEMCVTTLTFADSARAGGLARRQSEAAVGRSDRGCTRAVRTGLRHVASGWMSWARGPGVHPHNAWHCRSRPVRAPARALDLTRRNANAFGNRLPATGSNDSDMSCWISGLEVTRGCSWRIRNPCRGRGPSENWRTGNRSQTMPSNDGHVPDKGQHLRTHTGLWLRSRLHTLCPSDRFPYGFDLESSSLFGTHREVEGHGIEPLRRIEVPVHRPTRFQSFCSSTTPGKPSWIGITADDIEPIALRLRRSCCSWCDNGSVELVLSCHPKTPDTPRSVHPYNTRHGTKGCWSPTSTTAARSSLLVSFGSSL